MYKKWIENLQKKNCWKIFLLKIAEKTYTSIPALLFRLDQGRDILVEPKTWVVSLFCTELVKKGGDYSRGGGEFIIWGRTLFKEIRYCLFDCISWWTKPSADWAKQQPFLNYLGYYSWFFTIQLSDFGLFVL